MKLIRELLYRNSAAAWFGILNFIAFAVLLSISALDQRTLISVNIWIKPMKFCISIGIFSWTMAWFLHHLPQIRKVRIITFVIIGMLGIELLIIIMQAARGELSHYNISNLLNAVLFQIMGIAIVANTFMVFWTFRLFGKAKQLPAGYLLGIRLGMLVFIIASLEGFLMTFNLGHTVGAADGQEGIFFLNWAKSYGDLRVFHFLGLHGLQIIPLFAWYFSREKRILVVVFAVIYLLFSLGTLWNALAGKGLFDFGITSG